MADKYIFSPELPPYATRISRATEGNNNSPLLCAQTRTMLKNRYYTDQRCTTLGKDAVHVDHLARSHTTSQQQCRRATPPHQKRETATTISTSLRQWGSCNISLARGPARTFAYQSTSRQSRASKIEKYTSKHQSENPQRWRKLAIRNVEKHILKYCKNTILLRLL